MQDSPSALLGLCLFRFVEFPSPSGQPEIAVDIASKLLSLGALISDNIGEMLGRSCT